MVMNFAWAIHLLIRAMIAGNEDYLKDRLGTKANIKLSDKIIDDNQCRYSSSIWVNGVEHELIVRPVDQQNKLIEIAEKIANG